MSNEKCSRISIYALSLFTSYVSLSLSKSAFHGKVTSTSQLSARPYQRWWGQCQPWLATTKRTKVSHGLVAVGSLKSRFVRGKSRNAIVGSPLHSPARYSTAHSSRKPTLYFLHKRLAADTWQTHQLRVQCRLNPIGLQSAPQPASSLREALYQLLAVCLRWWWTWQGMLVASA